MSKRATWNRLLATTVISGFASIALANPALAQDTTPTQPDDDEDVPVPYSSAPTTGGEAPELEPSSDEILSTEGSSGTTITVTGTRIARPDLTSTSPVAVIDDEQVSLTGTQNLEQLLNDLPQVAPGLTQTSNNPSGNFQTLDLRGLGANRTLILVDSDRIPASSTTGIVDISQIPIGLIERIDVVTGGATAVYGSDAVAGVINFILKQDFEGIEITGQTGIAEEGVGFNYTVNGLAGGNFADGRGNLAVFAGYSEREPVFQNRFDYSRTSAAIYYDPNSNMIYPVDELSDITPDSFAFFAGGSATPPWGQVANSAANPFSDEFVEGLPTNPNCAPNSSGHLSFDPVTGQLTPYFDGDNCVIPLQSIGSSRYNYAPANYLILPFNRFNLSTIGRYDFTDRTTGRIFAAYTDSFLQNALAPTPAAGGTGFTIDPTTAVLIPDELRDALESRPDPDAPFLFNRRFSETGPRIGNVNNRAIIGRLTLEHELAPAWDINGSVSWGRNNLINNDIGNINRVAVEQGLNGCVNTAGEVGGPGVIPGCVPVDIFGPNTLTPAMLDFVQIDTTDRSRFEQVRGSVNLVGELFDLWGGPVGIAIGAEVRNDRGEYVPDDAKRRGEIIGFNASEAQAGQINVKEIYGETRLPIISGGGFPDTLAVEFGARYSDYSTIGGIFNWKAAGEFAPVNWLRFRGAYNKAARAPNIQELFQAGDQGFPPAVDPCSGAGDSGDEALIEQCIASGIPASLIDTYEQPNSQVQAFAFGQPDLEEEKAETFTIGAVVNPDWWPIGRMSLTVDYYDITLRGRIQALSAQFYISQCFTGSDGPQNADACSRIFRDPTTGDIIRVNTGRRNSPDVGGPLETRGIDVGFNWAVPIADVFGGLGDGTIRISELLTRQLGYEVGGVDVINQLGSVGALSTVVSKWTSALTVGYENGGFTGQVRWIYRTGADWNAGDLFGSAYSDIGADPITAFSNIDLNLRQAVSDQFDVTFIVENLLNELPPQSAWGAAADQQNTIASFYSPWAIGRNYTVQARIRF